MLEDSWSLVTIISDLVDNILYCAEHGLGSFSFGIFAAFTCAGFLLYFAWLSTDIPDLPEPPRPPYVIQIQGNVTSNRTGSGGGSGRDPNRQTLSDVRLLSSGPIVDSVLQNLPQSARQRHQQQQQQQQQQHQHQHGRPSALFFGFLRRPAPQPLIPIRPSRSRFQSSNVVVYHQVNVFRANGNQSTSNNNVNSSPGSASENESGTSISPSNNIESSGPEGETNLTSYSNTNVVPGPESSSSGLRNRSFTSGTGPAPVSGQDNSGTYCIPQFPGPSNSTLCGPGSSSGSGSFVRDANDFPSSTRRSLINEGDVLDFDSDVDELEVELDEDDLDIDDLDLSDSRTAVDVSVNGDVRIVEGDFSDSFVSSLPSVASSSSSSSSAHSHAIPATVSTHKHFQGDINVTSNSSPCSNPTPNPTNLVNVNMTRTSETINVKSRDEAQDKSRIDHSNPASTKHIPVPINSNTNSSSTKSPPQNEPTQDVRVILKFLNDTQIEVTTQLTEKILDFKRRHFATELSENKVVRLIFNGRVLDNDVRTLEESGIFDHCVVHCLIVTPQPSHQRGGDGGGGSQSAGSGGGSRNSSSGLRLGRQLREGGPEPGMFFVSVLGIVLIFLWFICFHFGQQLFTQSAVVSLVVLTAVFVIGLVALYLPVQSNNA